MTKDQITFGVQIEPQFGFTYPEIKEIALETEKIGLSNLWVSDHFFLDINSEKKNCLEAWTLLASLATVTEKLRLGALVSCQSYRYPALLAKIAASIDSISNGRLEFGIGAGWKEIEYNAYGIPFPSYKTRMEQLEDTIEIVKKMWTEEKATFEGNHYSIKEAICSPKPVQKPMPPIYVGGAGEKYLLKIVAKHADWCNLFWFLDPGLIKKKLEVLKTHCKSVGRDYSDIGKSFFAYVIIAESEDAVEEYIADGAKQRNLSIDESKKRMSVVTMGTPEMILKGIQEYINLGFTHFQVMFPYEKMFSKDLTSFPRFLESLKLLGEKVIKFV